MLLLLVPFLKQHTSLLNKQFISDDLRGYFQPVDSAHFSWQNWMEGKYQSQQEAFLKRDLKFRPHAVRANNQLHYDLLGEIRSTIVEGEDGYFFESNYIRTMQGLDFLGTKKIEDQVKKLKAVADTLKKANDIDIMVVIALDKARYLKEKLPDHFDLEQLDSTNYETYLHFFDKNNIQVLDFNQYFLDQKNKTKHTFATKQGVHWSLYGGLTAADSIQSYIGKIKGKENEINRLNKNEITKTTKARKEDDDIGQSINMYFPLETDTFSYFENYLVQKNEQKPYKPNVVLVGDSFCWTIWGQDIPHYYWGDNSLFLYYYREIYDLHWSDLNGTSLEEIQRLTFAKKQDVIILLYTPMNMNVFGSGFIEDTYDLIFGKK